MSEPNNNKKGEMIPLGGLWVNETKDGQQYLSGYLGQAKLLIFINQYKQEDKHPDYVMYVAPNKPKPEGTGKAKTLGGKKSGDPADDALPPSDDDIPF